MDSVRRNSLAIAVLVILDQLIKYAVQESTPDISFGLFSIVLARNTGASFSILTGQNTLLIFIGLIALGLIMMNVKQISRAQELPMSIIVAGILGNLIDRAFRGHVIDYIDFHWWPVFNLADSCIFIGVFWMVYTMWNEEPKSKPARENKTLQAKKAAKKLKDNQRRNKPS
jgi:signal peptidase II